MAKTCTMCHETKELTEFVKRRSGTQGVTPYCKKCYLANYAPDKEYRRAYHKTENGKRLKREYNQRYAWKNKARKLANKAISDGLLVKGPCAFCGSDSNIEAHHPDYSKPLDVEWLCHRHHTDLHMQLKSAMGPAA